LKADQALLAIGPKLFANQPIYYADTSFFKIFDYEFSAGSADRVLVNTQEAVITEDVAITLFGSSEPIGETILVGKEKKPYTVTGVVRRQKFKTHLSWSGIWLSIHDQLTNSSDWLSASFYNYVLLSKKTKTSDLWAALDKVFEKNVFPESGVPNGYRTIESYKKDINSVKFYVHSLRDIYLESDLNAELAPGGSKKNIYTFGFISLVILVLAAVNFVSLTTAKSAGRAKEVGLRKALGTSQTKLIFHFLGEAAMTTLVSLVLALFLAEVLLFAFQFITGESLLPTIWINPGVVLLFCVFALFVGALSGIYPAFVLSAFVPAKVLKGNVTIVAGSHFRNGLVVFQFSISLVLITCAAIVYQQLRFMKAKDLGFDQSNIITVDKLEVLKSAAEPYQNELAQLPGVINTSVHFGQPGRNNFMLWSYQTSSMQEPLSIKTICGDADYLSVMGMKLTSGRNVTRNLTSESEIIINQAAAKALNLGPDPVGAVVNENMKVVGVVSDFHWESMRSQIAPLVIVGYVPPLVKQLAIKVNPASSVDLLERAEAKWKEMAPGEPFEYHFVDENFANLVRAETFYGKVIATFTILAIFISCLGLYGLSAYTAEQRTREIGVRKVVGASVSEIVLLLSTKFTRLILVAALISIPLSFYLCAGWLETFAYRIEIGPGVFVFAVLSAVIIGWGTVSYHTLKAAFLNPIHSLKSE
jgi:putative ABC transport system permease protein